MTRHPNVPDWISARFGELPEWLVFLFQFKTYAALFVIAAAATALATPIYILLARRLDWLDRPGGRKQHAGAIATMGGLVIFAVVFAGSLVSLSLDNRVGEMLQEHATQIFALLICTASMVGLGIIDDRSGVRPKVKFLVQFVVAIAAIWCGYQIKAVTVPVLDSVSMPAVVGVILSLIWIVGITNAVNLTDGLDGLAVGVCFLASIVNAIVAVWLGNYYMAVMMFLLAGALLGFLRWNFHPARVFLGDTGSLGLGMYLALCSLHSAQKAHTVVLILVPLFALGYPIFDTLLTVARRSLRGQPLFASDRDHIHHRLLERGQSHSAAAIQIYVVSVILCIACLVAVTTNHMAIGLAIVGVFAMAVFCVRFLGYLEWGGRTHRRRLRGDTKLLHAAATLARLKLERASSDRDLQQAVTVFAAELGCTRVALCHRDAIVDWNAQLSENAANERQSLEMALSDGDSIRFEFAGPAPDIEQRGLLEDLCMLLGERLRHSDVDSPPKS